MHVDPAAKDLSFTSQTYCPDVNVTGSQDTDEFSIIIAYPQMNRFNKFPSFCVSVNVSVPPTYAFDPDFQLSVYLKDVSAIINAAHLSIPSLALNTMSGNVEVTNVNVLSQIKYISTVSGGIKLSNVSGPFTKAKISSMSGDIDVSEFGSSAAGANFDVGCMSGSVNINLVIITTLAFLI
jgi:hypothetical protein